MGSTPVNGGGGARPTLWRTCRALANTTRLEILRKLIEEPGQCVSAVAVKMHLSRPAATLQLRHLAARGLLRAQKKGPWVHYSADPDPNIPEARPLLQALRETIGSDGHAVRHIFELVTAFTDPRRQAIYEALRQRDHTFGTLEQDTGISRWALRRHLEKLLRRGFVVRCSGRFGAVTPPGPMARLLAELAPKAAR